MNENQLISTQNILANLIVGTIGDNNSYEGTVYFTAKYFRPVDTNHSG